MVIDYCFLELGWTYIFAPGLNRISTLLRWEGRLVHTDPSIGLDEEAAARMLETGSFSWRVGCAILTNIYLQKTT